MKVTCPAADMLGSTPGDRVVLCGVVRHERRKESTARQRDTSTGVVVSERDDPSTLTGFCCDRYQQCPVWRAARDNEIKRADQRRADEQRRRESNYEALEAVGCRV